jgi:hypothetical protein
VVAKFWKGSGTTVTPSGGNWSQSSNWQGGVPVDGDRVFLHGNTSYTVTLDTNSADLHAITIDGSGGVPTLDVGTSLLNVTNNIILGHGLIKLEGGEIAANSMEFDDAVSNVTGFGILNISGGYTGTGTIDAKGGLLEVEGTVGRGINLQIDGASGGDLKLDGNVGTSESHHHGTVTFDGAGGTLDLTGEGRGSHGEMDKFHDTVVGFGLGDEILVKGQAGDTLSFNEKTNVLTVKHGNHVEETIQLKGHYTKDEFQIDSGDTDVITIRHDDAPCFMAGTQIATPGGTMSVELLKRGDVVLTADGAAVPVEWIGRQTVSTVFADPLRVLPIRIKAGAIAENVPSRDLLLSPDHAIAMDGALIQAGALVNGTSIIREHNVPQTFTYYHVELDNHALILAENTPAETFVDNVERLAFDNWAEHEALFPEGKSIEELPYPRAKAHRQVPVNIRVKLAERAQAIGAADVDAAVA